MTDAEIIEATLRGDREKFRNIVERYQNAACAVALSITKDIPSSRDIALESFTQAYMKLRTLRNPEKFGKWLLKIVKNLSLNRLRSNKSYSRSLENMSEIAITKEQAEDEMTQKELKDIINGTIWKLSDKLREAMIMYYWEGRSVKEISEITGINESAIKNRLFMGRKKIKDELYDIVEEYFIHIKPGKEFTDRVMAVLPVIPLKTGISLVSLSGYLFRVFWFPLMLISQVFLIAFWQNKLFTGDLQEKNGLQKRIFYYRLARKVLFIVLFIVAGGIIVLLNREFWYYSIIGFFTVFLLPVVLKRYYLYEKGKYRMHQAFQIMLIAACIAVLWCQLAEIPRIISVFVIIFMIIILSVYFYYSGTLKVSPRQDRSVVYRFFDKEYNDFSQQKNSISVSSSELLGFARFLFTRQYILDSANVRGGRLYFLVPVIKAVSFLPRSSSHFLINSNGNVSTYISDSDYKSLKKLIREGHLINKSKFTKENLIYFCNNIIKEVINDYLDCRLDRAESNLRGRADIEIFKDEKYTRIMPRYMSFIIIEVLAVTLLLMVLLRYV